MKRFAVLVHLSIFITFCTPPKEPQSIQCVCAIEETKDVKLQREKNESNQASKIDISGGIDAVVKKAVDAKISISGSYSNSSSKIEEVYSEIINVNPQITQKANLFRNIACAYYEIVCQDKSLSEQSKSKQLKEVIAGYEKNIIKILIDENETIKEDDPGPKLPSQKKNSQSEVSQNEKSLEDGITIILKDSISKEPIQDAIFTFTDYPTPLRTNKFGKAEIPKKLIDKFGEYNSVRATIEKKGYQTEEINIALSESHSLFLNKIQ